MKKTKNFFERHMFLASVIQVQVKKCEKGKGAVFNFHKDWQNKDVTLLLRRGIQLDPKFILYTK